MQLSILNAAFVFIFRSCKIQIQRKNEFLSYVINTRALFLCCHQAKKYLMSSFSSCYMFISKEVTL